MTDSRYLSDSYNTLTNNNINSNFNSNLAEELESLKYEFINMSRKHEEQISKYEDLHFTNQFLMSKYKELKYQFKLRELDIRTNLIETISNQIINRKLESFLSVMEMPRHKEENNSNLIISNPFYEIRNSESVLSKSIKNQKEDTNHRDNLPESQQIPEENKNTLDSEKSKSSDCNDILKEPMYISLTEENKKLKEKLKSINGEKEKVSITQKETMDVITINPFIEKKKPLTKEIIIIKEEEIQIENQSEDKNTKEEKNHEQSKENQQDRSTENNLSINNNIFKKSLKQVETIYIKEETLKNLTKLEDARDEETQSNESNSSQIKTKNKKKQNKSKKNNKKTSKLNSDTESDLDYTRDSIQNPKKTKKNQKLTDYEEDIEEEKSQEFDVTNKSFREKKKTKKKTKKPKKGKK